jgi:lysozyme
MAEKYIPDLSQWNGTIDFAAVKEQHDAVILRASCGLIKDEKFDYNIKQAFKYGLKVGVYHFLNATTPANAVNECKAFYAAIKPYKSQISFFVLDFESSGMLQLTDSNKIKLYHAFSDRLRDTYKIKNRVLYTWEWLGEKFKKNDKNYDFSWEWYAAYGKNDGKPNGLVTKSWLHQFTSKSKQKYDQSTFTDLNIILNGKTLADLCGEVEEELPVEDESQPDETPKAEEKEEEQNNSSYTEKKAYIAKPSAWNIRTGNGKDYEVIKSAPSGSFFPYVATAVNGWVAVEVEGQIGWITPEAVEVR